MISRTVTSDPGPPQTSPALASRPHVVLLHEQLIGTRLQIHVWVRFAAVLGIVGGALFAEYVLDITELNLPGLMIVALLLGIHNLGVYAAARHYGSRDRSEAAYVFLARLMHATIVTDFVFLTIILWFVGGAKSPFKVFYTVHVMIASILLSRRAACVHALVGFLLFSGLVIGQWLEWIPSIFPVGAVNSDVPLNGRFVLSTLVAQGLVMALSVFLLSSLSLLLRRGEEDLRLSNQELTKLSEMRRDLLQIALHDLKAPLAAANMLLHSLDATPDGALSSQQRRLVDRAKERLRELTVFIRDLEMLSVLETSDIEKQQELLDLAAVLRETIHDSEDLAQMHGHSLVAEIPETLPAVKGVGLLLREAVSNLISNAVKYTPDGGTIRVRAVAERDRVRIEVEDTGIGIALSDRGRLFREFSRLRRGDPQVRRTGGSGLGLSIVRRIVEEHGGVVDFHSELNKGSTFFIVLPAAPTEARVESTASNPS